MRFRLSLKLWAWWEVGSSVRDPGLGKDWPQRAMEHSASRCLSPHSWDKGETSLLLLEGHGDTGEQSGSHLLPHCGSDLPHLVGCRHHRCSSRWSGPSRAAGHMHHTGGIELEGWEAWAPHPSKTEFPVGWMSGEQEKASSDKSSVCTWRLKKIRHNFLKQFHVYGKNWVKITEDSHIPPLPTPPWIFHISNISHYCGTFVATDEPILIR